MSENPLIKTRRRKFLKTSALGLSAATFAPSLMGKNLKNPLRTEDKLGVAIIGLSGYAKNAIAPGLLATEYCELVGFVTGNPGGAKATEFKKQYKIPAKNIYSYDNFDQISENPDIDMVYVLLPNGLHAEYTIRAAKAGKHVMCEKPMEVSVEKGQAMIDACKEAGALLQIGYRCQYDPFHKEMMRLSQEKVYGEVKLIESSFSFFGMNSDNWRFTNKALSGGGPMVDVGVYCIQGARYTLGAEPIAVTARTYKTYKDKLPDMEETIVWEMEFASGAVASCVSSYAAHNNHIHVSAEKGSFGIRDAFVAHGDLDGYFGNEKMNFPSKNKQAVQMDAFARNILDGTPVIASGEDGLQDLRIIEAVYKAAETGTRVML